MLGCSNFCRTLLSEARGDLIALIGRKKTDEIFRGMYTDRSEWGTDKYFWVNDRTRKKLWEGSACCSYHAKYNAILKQLDKEIPDGSRE